MLSTEFDCRGACGHRGKPVPSLADEPLQSDVTVGAIPLLVAVHSHSGFGVFGKTLQGECQSAFASEGAASAKWPACRTACARAA